MSNTSSNFAEGDTVELKSGGPVMTIKGVGKYGMAATRDSALCTWFEGKTMKEAVFELATLKLAENKPHGFSQGKIVRA